MFTMPQPAASTSTRKRGLKVGKKIENLNRVFRALPREHKKAVVYRALGEAANLKADTVEKHCSLALSLIEGS